MLPAGKITEDTIETLSGLLEKGDTIIDGGNTFYKDDIRRSKSLIEKGIDYVDVGTSGGVWGLERGFCMMIGGPDAVVAAARSDLRRAGARRIGDIVRTVGREGDRDRCRRRAISTPAPRARGISSRWSTTASNMA